MKQLTEETLKTLNSYTEVLYKWNKKFNLTALTEEEFYKVALIDSLALYEVLKYLKIRSLADIGTGFGLPGMVLKIVDPSLEVTLIDASEKKVAFLEFVSKILKLELEIQNKRLPDKNWNRLFCCIVSKASMKEGLLIKTTNALLERGGSLIYYHGMSKPVNSEILPLKGVISYKRENGTLSNIIIRKKQW